MADPRYTRPYYHQTRGDQGSTFQGIAGYLSEKSPNAHQALTAAVVLPISGVLLALSAMTFTATVLGLAVATPLFILFSPVLVPAAIAVALAVAGVLTAGALGVVAVAALSWMVGSVRRSWEQQQRGVGGRGWGMDRARGVVEGVGEYVGQKTKDLGQGIQNLTHEGVTGRAHDDDTGRAA